MPQAKRSLAALPNLGPKSCQALASAGITTADRLRELGAVAAYARVKRKNSWVSLNLLWALEAALSGMAWQVVAREHRTSLLLALEDHERQSLTRPRAPGTSGIAPTKAKQRSKHVA